MAAAGTERRALLQAGSVRARTARQATRQAAVRGTPGLRLCSLGGPTAGGRRQGAPRSLGGPGLPPPCARPEAGARRMQQGELFGLGAGVVLAHGGASTWKGHL